MNTPNTVCRICGEGYLRAKVDQNCVEYRGRRTKLDCEYSVCDACGSDQANAGQLRRNKRAMMAFRKQVGKLLADA